MNQDNKNKFLIFLDFDGVLNDIKNTHILKMGGFFVHENDNETFCKSSIEAINYLIDSLSQKYDIELVLSTFWKHFFKKAVKILKNNGLEYQGKINRTSFFLGQRRSKEIFNYLASNDEWIDFLIIDDKMSLKKYFVEKNFLKTNIWNGALKMSDVSDYLNKYFPELAKGNALENKTNF